MYSIQSATLIILQSTIAFFTARISCQGEAVVVLLRSHYSLLHVSMLQQHAHITAYTRYHVVQCMPSIRWWCTADGYTKKNKPEKLNIYDK